jgi:putative FmdB family regulatory protein
MPIYEYRCENGHAFEVLQRMSDPPVTTCEIDGGSVERVFSPVAVHFKGSGFYSTDYGSKKRSRELKEAGEGTGKYAKDGASGDSSSKKSESSSASTDSSPKSDTGSGKAQSERKTA